MRPFEGLLQQPAFVVGIASATAVVSAMLAGIAYLQLAIHQHGAATFAGLGALMTAFFAWRYFRDALLLRHRVREGSRVNDGR